MERTDLFELMGELKLYGMRLAYDEVMTTGIKRQLIRGHSFSRRSQSFLYHTQMLVHLCRHNRFILTI